MAGALDLLAQRRLQTQYGDADEFLFRYANTDVVALALGRWRARRIPVRIHSACFSAHYLASIECDCREQLEVTLHAMTEFGGGIVIFLDQDGRGNGHAGLMRSAKMVREAGGTAGDAYEALGYLRDARSYHVVPLVLKALGVDDVILFTNNPTKLKALTDAEIAVETQSVVALQHDSERLGQYYESKRAEGHAIPR